MVDIVERMAARDWFVEDQQGNRQDVKRGKSYTTTKEAKDGQVILFSSYWVRVPLDVFAEPADVIECPHCRQDFVRPTLTVTPEPR